MKEARPYLLHMRDAIARIVEYTAAGKEDFFADRKTQDAVVRNLEIIGEAAKKLPDDLKTAHPDVPWKRIAGMRDKVIHEYFGVNLALVWNTVAQELPRLDLELEQILDGLGPH